MGALVVLAVAEAGCDGGDAPSSTEPPFVRGDPGGGVLAEQDYAAMRDRLVQHLSRSIEDKRVLDAMRRIPRHEFVPPGFRSRSYHDGSLPIGEGQTISRPSVVALMTSLLDLDGTERVLEVGTGSGYQAALLGELAREVYTIEIRPALKEAADQKLRELRKEGVLRGGKIVTILGDGSKGYPEAQPFECIVVTAAPGSVPVELLNQLEPGGRMVVPVGQVVQELQLIRKGQDGSFSTEFVSFVRFAELIEEDG